MSQQLGLNYQMSPEVMYITPNIWRLGIIFISVMITVICDEIRNSAESKNKEKKGLKIND